MKTTSLLQGRLLLFCMLFSCVMAACSKDDATESAAGIGKSASAKKAAAAAKSGPVNVCYVEVNNYDIGNVGKYTLDGSGANVFDIGIIFAANINYDTNAQKAVLFFNPQVTSTLQNIGSIRTLQNKGIKVLLSILGNHQGAGVSNFPNQAAANDFAAQCADAVNTYGLDGIDIDDEYANYGANGTGQPNESSFVYFITELRRLLPDKIISFYYIGPAISRQSYAGVTVGSKVDYAWNPYYSTYSAPNVPGLGNDRLGPAAVDITATSSATANSFASRTVSDGYGVYLCYNLTNNNTQSYLNGITQALYGENTVYTP
ncbi:MAG: chitinase [Mucilaginibacter polytrichastri]|nr:chitinase [Mucilaginibacter polytrichastri]